MLLLLLSRLKERHTTGPYCMHRKQQRKKSLTFVTAVTLPSKDFPSICKTAFHVSNIVEQVQARIEERAISSNQR